LGPAQGWPYDKAKIFIYNEFNVAILAGVSSPKQAEFLAGNAVPSGISNSIKQQEKVN